MPAIILGFPEIEAQLRNIRRRRNALTLQQTVYWSGGGLLLLAAALVVLALRTSATFFTIGLWSSVLITIALVALGGRHLWRNWLSARRTVRWADITGQLEDRLATLAAHHRQPQASRLAGLVMTQLITLRHRWEPATLIPRRVPRSIYFFVTAIVLLIATMFLERREPPAAPPMAHAMRGAEGRVPNAKHPRVQLSPSGQPGSNDSTLGSGDNWEVVARQSGTGKSQTGKRNAADRNNAAAPGQQKGALPAAGMKAGPAERGAAGAEHASGGETTQEQMAERVQTMIRTALGAPPPDSDPPDQTRAGRDKEPPRQGARGEQAESSGAEKNKLAEARRLRPDDSEGSPHRHDPRADVNKQGDDPQKNGANSSGTMAGAGPGGGNPFGAPSTPAGNRTLTQTFQLKLASIAAGLRTLTEPQNDNPPSAPPAPRTGAPAESRLSERDREDDALVRPDIAPEHEAIVKRIFAHAEPSDP